MPRIEIAAASERTGGARDRHGLVSAAVRHGTSATTLRFAAVGAFTTLLDIALFWLATSILLAPTGIANIASYGTGVMVSFIANKVWTFRDRRQGDALLKQAMRFLALHVSSVALSTAVVVLLAMFTQLLVAKAISIPLVFIWNRIMTEIFVFNARHAP